MAKKKIKNKRKQLNEQAVMASIKNISNEVLAAAYSVSSSVVPPVLQKVCRLCESKDGPFLNIFDADKVTAKKIDELMPFSVLENDDLPHKICFRCSAKLEELYEFIQRCIKTQENLRNAVGSSGPLLTKSKIAKKVWEEKLNQNNMSNDDICDALIKKAMAGIQGIAVEETLPTEETKVLPPEEPTPVENKRTTRSKEAKLLNFNIKTESQTDSTDDISLQQIKMALDSEAKPVKNKGKRSPKIGTDSKSNTNEAIQQNTTNPNNSQNLDVSLFDTNSLENKTNLRKTNNSMSSLSFDEKEPAVTASIKEEKEEETKPFNIMDYISMIKVNGVGTLFQCKICNRNFLKKEMVESHNCAKNGMRFLNKIDVPKSIPTPEPPKIPTVKYIKIDNDMKKTLTEKVRNAEKNEPGVLETIDLQDDSDDSTNLKHKPKVGPASKTRRKEPDLDTPNQSTAMPLNTEPPNISMLPSIQFATIPNINSRFKLCPGPNNVFTLVEDTNATLLTPAPPTEVAELKKQSRKRKSTNETVNNTSNQKVVNTSQPELSKTIQKTNSPDVIDVENQAKPYPVGLFQTLPNSARLYEPTVPAGPPAFTTPAMKKQSYTIVQTGNPSKLLISAKAVSVENENPKKRQRKSKIEVRDDFDSKEPFKVTLEDRTLAQEKDSNFFTFINVDPLLQPSYVLPTDNIIQESQISTSSSVQPGQNKSNTEKDKYSCNMCNESFTREKKLLTHIQAHYNQMDEEDQKRVEKNTKKKRKN